MVGGIGMMPRALGVDTAKMVWAHPGDVHFPQDHCHPVTLQWSGQTERPLIQQKLKQRRLLLHDMAPKYQRLLNTISRETPRQRQMFKDAVKDKVPTKWFLVPFLHIHSLT